MNRWLVLSIAVALVLTACGPHAYIPEHRDQAAQIIVSAYTQDGCLENLNDEAKQRGVEVNLLKIETDLGWQIAMWPMYKGYKCIGEVVGPVKAKP